MPVSPDAPRRSSGTRGHPWQRCWNCGEMWPWACWRRTGLELGAGSWLQCACHLAMIAVTAHVLPEPEATRVQHRDEGRTSDSQMGEG